MKTGEIIKKLRKEKRITQQQLGDILGVQKSAVAKWENGHVHNLKSETINAIAVYFGVRPSYIRGETDEILMLNQEEIDLIKAFRKATDHQKQIVILTLKGSE